MQNSVISTRIASLYGSQSSSVVFACKTAPFGWELQVSLSPRLLLLICECKTADLVPEWCLSIGPSLHLWFCAFKTATLVSKLLVSMGPRPHLLFCACKTTWLPSELLVSTGTSPHMWFLHAKHDFWIRITSLYWFQISPFDLCIQNSVLRSTMTLVCWSQPSSVVCAFKTATLASEILLSMGPSSHLWLLHAKQRL